MHGISQCKRSVRTRNQWSMTAMASLLGRREGGVPAGQQAGGGAGGECQHMHGDGQCKAGHHRVKDYVECDITLHTVCHRGRSP
jgi:hypothetical protein